MLWDDRVPQGTRLPPNHGNPRLLQNLIGQQPSEAKAAQQIDERQSFFEQTDYRTAYIAV